MSQLCAPFSESAVVLAAQFDALVVLEVFAVAGRDQVLGCPAEFGLFAVQQDPVGWSERGSDVKK